MTTEEWKRDQIRKVKADRKRKAFIYNLSKQKAREEKMNKEFAQICGN